MSPLYLYNGKLLLVDGGLAIDENCCCETTICCYCIEVSYYFGTSNNKPFAGTVSRTGNWGCESIYRLPNGNIVSTPSPPPGAEFIGYNCSIGVVCRASEAAWGGQAPFPHGVNEGIDNSVDGQWTKDKKYSYCMPGLSKEECERCRPVEQDGDLINFDDLCGKFHAQMNNKKCCDIPPEWEGDCFCDT